MNEVKKTLPVDIAVCAAAVSDYKPINKNKNKIKKNISNIENIKIEKNPDILDYLSKNNKTRPKIVVGFSAETENVVQNSKKKIKSNLIVVLETLFNDWRLKVFLNSQIPLLIH